MQNIFKFSEESQPNALLVVMFCIAKIYFESQLNDFYTAKYKMDGNGTIIIIIIITNNNIKMMMKE